MGCRRAMGGGGAYIWGGGVITAGVFFVCR